MARNYCLVENGIVVDGPRDLPKAWRNISGLNNSTNEEFQEFIINGNDFLTYQEKFLKKVEEYNNTIL